MAFPSEHVGLVFLELVMNSTEIQERRAAATAALKEKLKEKV